MRSGSPTLVRAISILVIAVVGVALVATVAPGASKPLTRKKAVKLFFTKKKSDRRYLAASTERAGHASCSALTWQESSSTPGFSSGETGGYARISTDGGTFNCNMDLPHGGVITGARFAVADFNPVSSVACELERVRLSPPIGSGGVIASPGSSPEGAPGDMVLSTTAISEPVVDNANFAYLAQCSWPSSGGGLGAYGAIVDYTLRADRGAAT